MKVGRSIYGYKSLSFLLPRSPFQYLLWGVFPSLQQILFVATETPFIRSVSPLCMILFVKERSKNICCNNLSIILGDKMFISLDRFKGDKKTS